jgi:Clostripain family
MRQDLHELTQSPAVQDPSIITWVYFDARNLGSVDEEAPDILEPLQGVYNADGTALTDKFEGSRYFAYDHSQDKMVIETILADEQDSDNPATLSTFVQHALTDCVAKGTSEYMMIFSSHGGGFAGFGADDHERRVRGRILNYQSNLSILTALQDSLKALAGAPTQLDVLGFDACLMQSADALDEYREIAKYYMASEATEPGHGERKSWHGVVCVLTIACLSRFTQFDVCFAVRMGL